MQIVNRGPHTPFMRKFFFLLLFIGVSIHVFSQSYYWVVFTDKKDVVFDPYSYFDVKAIDRYKLNGADLYHISNYPLNASYVNAVSHLAESVEGESRWFNAVAVAATTEQMAQISRLPFVAYVRDIVESDARLAEYDDICHDEPVYDFNSGLKPSVEYDEQLLRMQGNLFGDAGYDGKGVRIAVFDNGFTAVDRHMVFEHLRSGNQIVATWNFPKKESNVYGWGSHGTNTLSCIAGMAGSTKLGLATGADFLLARTEVNLEPFKEEIWWMQAVEWADKHGANIISSSLGYGKDRYFSTDMDGTSFVAKAANMAARKGMLVCNSAGNEGDDEKWKTIITPADADSVLCVGGITRNSGHEHISFSSYGPSADGRLKPNVVAFAKATVAHHAQIDKLKSVYGTSFSCPLVAGFAACAWQASPGKTAMEMFDAIEKSADLYPYFDYAFGYGVPQASYFVGRHQEADAPTFSFGQNDSMVVIRSTGAYKDVQLFLNVQNDKGEIEEYQVLTLSEFDSNATFSVFKSSLYKRTLNVSLKGYCDSFRLTDAQMSKLVNKVSGMPLLYAFADYDDGNSYWNRELAESEPFNYVSNKDRFWSTDFFMSFAFGKSSFTPSSIYSDSQVQGSLNANAFSMDLGVAKWRAISKRYYLGGSLAYSLSADNVKDELVVHDANNVTVSRKVKTGLHQNRVRAELLQRVVVVPGGLSCDMGVFASFCFSRDLTEIFYDKGAYYKRVNHILYNPTIEGLGRWDVGATLRFNYSVMGCFLRLILTDILFDNVETEMYKPAFIELGISIDI